MDIESIELLEMDLHDMAASKADAKFAEKLLKSSGPRSSWSIGEALAECLLADDSARDIVWPWNREREKFSPMASPTGMDLIGLCTCGGKTKFLIGEVKTSSESKVPPRVMNVNDGLPSQVLKNANSINTQRTILIWLRSRCGTKELLSLYRSAFKRFLQSHGQDILHMGILLRDTRPNEMDVSAAADYLAEHLDSPAEVEVSAWYFPEPIQEWPSILEGDET